MTRTEPDIVCFMCNSAFCQEDMRIPSNVNVARVNCVGRLDPAMLLEMFEKGSDAVLVAGCRPPDCHFVDGNLQAERAVKMVQKLLELTSLEHERLKLIWYTPSEGKGFNQHAKEFTREIEKFGPSPLKSVGAENRLMINVLAAKNAAFDFRLRVLLGREKELTEGVNVYGDKLSQEEFDLLLDEVVPAEFVRHKIHLLTKTKPQSVKELAEAVELKPAAVLKQIVDMRRRNMIALDHVDGTTPFYKALEVK